MKQFILSLALLASFGLGVVPTAHAEEYRFTGMPNGYLTLFVGTASDRECQVLVGQAFETEVGCQAARSSLRGNGNMSAFREVYGCSRLPASGEYVVTGENICTEQPLAADDPTLRSGGEGSGGTGRGFVALTNIPAFVEIQESGDLAAFLNSIYKYMIGIAAVLAVLQIVRAGVMYMTEESIAEKKEARHIILMSVLGLILVLSPAIVFGIINPQILNLQINVEQLQGTGDGTGDGTGTPGGDGDGAEAEAAAETQESCEAREGTWRVTETHPQGRCIVFGAGNDDYVEDVAPGPERAYTKGYARGYTYLSGYATIDSCPAEVAGGGGPPYHDPVFLTFEQESASAALAACQDQQGRLPGDFTTLQGCLTAASDRSVTYTVPGTICDCQPDSMCSIRTAQ